MLRALFFLSSQCRVSAYIGTPTSGARPCRCCSLTGRWSGRQSVYHSFVSELPPAPAKLHSDVSRPTPRRAVPSPALLQRSWRVLCRLMADCGSLQCVLDRSGGRATACRGSRWGRARCTLQQMWTVRRNDGPDHLGSLAGAQVLDERGEDKERRGEKRGERVRRRNERPETRGQGRAGIKT